MSSPRTKKEAHFILIPLMCPGHLIPMADMATIIAQRNATVTIITSPNNAARIQSQLQRAANSGLPLRLVKLPFPATEFGLPEGCENVDALPSIALMRNFFLANKALQEPIVEILKKTEPAPSCIVSDRNLPWAGTVAKTLGIPRVLFDGMSCFSRLLIHNLYLYKPYETVSDSSEKFVVTGVPGPIEFSRAQLPGMFNPTSAVEMEDIREEIRSSEKEADGVVINSFEEMEAEFVTLCRKLITDKVYCVGPVCLSNNSIGDMSQRGQKPGSNLDNMDVITNWLDSKPISSVIYCCFGSLNRVTCQQMIELGLGLEASRSPFIWVVRGALQGPELDSWLEEDGFEARVNGQGLILRGWVPQVLILSHPSVGGFLTHCGWNSTLEAVAYGVPMVTWPLFAEQFFNEKEVVEVFRVGVAVGAKVVVHLGEEDVESVAVVKREDIRVAVEKVMEGGEEGEERRKRAKEMAEMAKKAVAEGGSSYGNVIAMIEDIRSYA